MSDIKAMRKMATAPLKPGTLLADGYGGFLVVTETGGTERSPLRDLSAEYRAWWACHPGLWGRNPLL